MRQAGPGQEKVSIKVVEENFREAKTRKGTRQDEVEEQIPVSHQKEDILDMDIESD